MPQVVVTTAITTPPHLIAFWGALKVNATSIAERVMIISWSVLGDMPKRPAEAIKFIVMNWLYLIIAIAYQLGIESILQPIHLNDIDSTNILY